MSLAILTAKDREPTVRELRGRLSLRERHERFLSAFGLIEAAKDGGKDFRYVPQHGGPRALFDMAHDTTLTPAGSTNPGADS
jgi:hypothetical protein